MKYNSLHVPLYDDASPKEHTYIFNNIFIE